MRLLVVCLLAVAAATLRAQAPVTTPASAAQIVSDLSRAREEYRSVKAANVLAFSAEVDERPLYTEHALLLVEFAADRWRLVHTYRHPKDPLRRRRYWEVSIAPDSGQKGHEDFRQRPTETEVETFLRDSWWKWSPSPGFRLLRGEVYTDTWRRVLGYPTRHQFSRIEKP